MVNIKFDLGSSDTKQHCFYIRGITCFLLHIITSWEDRCPQRQKVDYDVRLHQ
jgi:hypothetical protein